MTLLALSFFATAFLYACIGFGGGSTYNALLVLGGVDYTLIPIISLICNIIVVSGGVWHFAREGHLRLGRIYPWIIFSVPASFIGGLIKIPEIFFTAILGIALLASGLRLLWPEKTIASDHPSKSYPAYLPAVGGTVLGLLAGITGIGGGIFLAPVLHFLNWGHAKQIAAACAAFILLNSLAGLMGQIIKSGHDHIYTSLLAYWPLLPAVIGGGQIGAWLGSARLNIFVIKKLTGVLICYVAIRLIFKWASMV